MTNREKLSSLSNEELSKKLCDYISDVAEAADIDDMCDACPVNKLCKKGHNGFLAWLNQETEDK